MGPEVYKSKTTPSCGHTMVGWKVYLHLHKLSDLWMCQLSLLCSRKCPVSLELALCPSYLDKQHLLASEENQNIIFHLFFS